MSLRYGHLMKLLKTYGPDSFVWIDRDYPLILAAGILRKSRSKSLRTCTPLARITKS